MTSPRFAEPPERMHPGPALSPPTHLLSQQSSDLDYAVAKQLIQHSQRARYNTETEHLDSGRDRPPEDYELSSRDENGLGKLDYVSRQQRQMSPRTTSQERSLDAQYSPLSNPPASGQMCRLVSEIFLYTARHELGVLDRENG